MRILHLTLSAARGGRRDAILTLTDHLRALGTECGLAALRNTADLEAEFPGRVDYYEGLEMAGRPSLRDLLAVRRLCQARRVQLIHAHDAGSQAVASALRIVAPSLRVVMTFHRTLGLESEGFRNKVRNALSLPMVDRILTASEERRQYFLAESVVPPSKVTVIPLGVDLTRFHPDPAAGASIRAELGLAPDTRLVLAVGHSGPEKGLDQAIRAMAAAVPGLGSRSWHLAIIGSGSPERNATLRDLARDTLGAERATFLGFRDDVPRWLQGADLLLHAPRMEAFGLVLVQAMASGLPVVATAVGGIPEIVVDGVSGRLVREGDITGLGAAVATLLADAAECRRLGAAGLARARTEYDAVRSAERHQALYRQLLDRAGGRALQRTGQPATGLQLAPTDGESSHHSFTARS